MKFKRKNKYSRARGIAETYIHIVNVPESLTKNEAYSYLEKNIYKLAEENFKHKVNVKIVLEDGSLIVKILIGGIAIFEFVSHYGSFRTGIDYIVKDAYKFSDMVIERFKEDEHIPNESIARAERRLGVPGKIQRFYKSMDKINSTQYSHNQHHELIEDLKDEFISIMELLEAEEDRELFTAEIPQNLIHQFPQTYPEPIIGSITLENFDEFSTTNLNSFPNQTIPTLPRTNQDNIPLIGNRNEDEE